MVLMWHENKCVNEDNNTIYLNTLQQYFARILSPSGVGAGGARGQSAPHKIVIGSKVGQSPERG